jgi:hypothetical protein
MNKIKEGSIVLCANTIGYEGKNITFGARYKVSSCGQEILKLEGVKGKFKRNRFIDEREWNEFPKSRKFKEQDLISITDNKDGKTNTFKIKYSYGEYLELIDSKGKKSFIHANFFSYFKIEKVDFKIPNDLYSTVRIASAEEIQKRIDLGLISLKNNSYITENGSIDKNILISTSSLGEEVDLLHCPISRTSLSISKSPDNLKTYSVLFNGISPEFGVSVPVELLTTVNKRYNESKFISLIEGRKKIITRKMYYPKIEDKVEFKKNEEGYSLDVSYPILNISKIESTNKTILKLKQNSGETKYIDSEKVKPSNRKNYIKEEVNITYKKAPIEQWTAIDYYITTYVENSKKLVYKPKWTVQGAPRDSMIYEPF